MIHRYVKALSCLVLIHIKFLLFKFRVCHAVLSVHCSLVATCWETAGLLAFLYMMFSRVLVTFPCGDLGQVWYLIASIPDLFLLPYLVVHTRQLVIHTGQAAIENVYTINERRSKYCKKQSFRLRFVAQLATNRNRKHCF